MPSPVKARTDSVLHTGMSSARDVAIRKKVKDRIQKKRTEAGIIAQNADVFIDWIDKKENEVCDLRDLLKHPDHPDAIVELTARAKQLSSLKEWRGQIKKLLSTPEEPVEDDEITEAWKKEANAPLEDKDAE